MCMSRNYSTRLLHMFQQASTSCHSTAVTSGRQPQGPVHLANSLTHYNCSSKTTLLDLDPNSQGHGPLVGAISVLTPAAHIPSCLIGNQHLGPAITMPCRPEMHNHVHSSWDVMQILHNCLLLCLPAVVGPGTSVAVIRCLLRR